MLLLVERAPDDGTMARVGATILAQGVDAYLSGQLKHSGFTELARSLLGRVAERAECEDALRRVALGNPLSLSAGTRGRPQPSEEDLQTAERLTSEWAAVTQAELVVFFGARLGAHLARCLECQSVTLGNPNNVGFSFRDQKEALLRALGPLDGERSLEPK